MDGLEGSGRAISRQIGHGAGVFDEFLEGGHDRRARKELAEKIDLPAKLLVRNGLDEFFGGGASDGIELCDLRGDRASDAKSLAFRGKLRNQADRVSAAGVDAPSSQKQVARERVTCVALQTGDAAETGDQTQPQLGKRETRHFVGDNNVAAERQLQAASEANAVDRGNRDERRGIDRVKHCMYAFQKLARTGEALFFGERGGRVIELAQVGPGRETMFARTGDDTGRCFRRERAEGSNELLEFREHGRADFVGGLMVESELNDSLSPFPSQRPAGKGFHGDGILSYMASISAA